MQLSCKRQRISLHHSWAESHPCGFPVGGMSVSQAGALLGSCPGDSLCCCAALTERHVRGLQEGAAAPLRRRRRLTGRGHAALLVLQLCSPSVACLPEVLYLNALWLLEFIIRLHLVKRSTLLSLLFPTSQLPRISSAFCDLWVTFVEGGCWAQNPVLYRCFAEIGKNDHVFHNKVKIILFAFYSLHFHWVLS